MGIVYAESLRGPSTELRTPRHRIYRVSTAAIRAEVREAVDSLGGLRARQVGVEKISEEPLEFRVEVSATMAVGTAVHATVPHIRDAVSQRLSAVFGSARLRNRASG